MNSETIDLWFGPGAEKGIFGAGVAHGLHEAIVQRNLDPSRIRLFGSSVGCLTAVFLATGNAASGLEIFQQETHKLVRTSKLVPSLGARFVNGLARTARLNDSWVSVPSVLDLEHVFEVMGRRTPDIEQQLRGSPTPIFAETVDRRGTYRHADLRSSDQPLREIRRALNIFPFAGALESDLMDSVINGYGFSELVRSSDRPLVVVLNAKVTTGSAFTVGDLVSAAFSADARIAQLYLRRRANRYVACQSALRAGARVLVVAPPQKISLKSPRGFYVAHQVGKQAAQRIIDFVNQVDKTAHSKDANRHSACWQ